MKRIITLLAAVLVLSVAAVVALGHNGSASKVQAIPVLVYHGISYHTPVVTNPANDFYYSVRLPEFRAQLEYLHRHGYQTISPHQYVAWAEGKAVRLPGKPILITFDDAQATAVMATPVLQSYGFHAVMFVASGLTDGLYGSLYMDWGSVRRLTASGWYVEFHAGACGHAYLTEASPKQCRTGLDLARNPSLHSYYAGMYGQSQQAYRARVVTDIDAGIRRIRSQLGLPSDWPTMFAAPFDMTGSLHSWLKDYLLWKFGNIFVQDKRTARLPGFHYRFEPVGVTTLPEFIKGLHSPEFTKEVS